MRKILIRKEVMTIYQVRLQNPNTGLEQVISVPDDQYILDIAEDEGIRLPFGCRQGECSACIAKLIQGKVNQQEQKFLSIAEQKEGYIVTCVTYPRSDCTLITHQEQVLYESSLYYHPPSSKKD